MSTLAGHHVTRATVYLPAQGVWSATVDLATDAQVAGRVELVVEDLTLQGTVVRGGASDSTSTWLLAGGAAGWRLDVGPKPYRNDLGVMLSTVAGDAAGEVGESVALLPGMERSLGPAYTRQAGPAHRVLSHARVPWWVDAAGVTQLGPRPAPTVTADHQEIRNLRRANARVIATAAPAAFAPGALLGDVVIREVVIRVNASSLRLEVRT